MLVENCPHPRWAICLPTKTGSTSLESVLKGGAAKSEGYKHAMTCHPTISDRVMLYRDPVERWWSIFRHHLNERTQFSDVARRGADEYAEAFFAKWDEHPLNYSTYIWTRSLAQIAKWFEPSVLFDVTSDDGRALLQYLKQPVSSIPKRRVSKIREAEAALSPEHQRRLEEWAAPDLTMAKSFGL